MRNGIITIAIAVSLVLGCPVPESAAAETDEGMMSLVDLAPELIWAVRRYPKFYGDKNTVQGDIFKRSYLSGTWGGWRDTLVEHGVNIDLGVTQVWQGNTSGGKGTGSNYSGSTDLWVNLDTGKLGLWPGANIFLHTETFWGNSIQSKVGSLIPVNFDSMMPDASDSATALSEAYIMQGLPANLMLAVGKVDFASLADTNVFANNERTQFLNTALVNNPILGVFIPYTALGGGLIWAPSKKHELELLVASNDGDAMSSGFDDLSSDKTTIGFSYQFSPTVLDRPGNYRVIVGYTTKDVADYEISNRVLYGSLIGNMPQAMKDDNYALLLNFDQHLYLKDAEGGEGWGLFGRAGWAPDDRNVIDQFYSFGIGGTGCLIPERPADTWGLGWAGTHFSGEFRDDLGALNLNSDSFEHAIEGFYNIMLTPAVHVSLDAQYIINPFSDFLADGGTGRQHAFVVGSRLQLDF